MRQLTRPRLVAAAVALTLSVSACGGSDEKTDAASKAAGRTAAAPGYEIAVPAGWRTTAEGGGELRLKAGRTGRDTAVVSVTRIPDPPPDATLPEVAELVRGRLLATVPGLAASDLGESRPVSLGGVPARSYEAMVTLEGHDATVRGVIALKDGALYTVLFTAAAGAFDARARDLESMLDSWQWKRADPAADGDREVKPATGAPVVGSGYQFNLPRGWRRVNLEQPPPGLEIPDAYVPPDALVSGKVIEGSPVGTSVVVEPTTSTSLDELIDAKGARYFGAGAAPTDTSLAGTPAVTASREREGIGDATMQSEIVVAIHDGKAYIVEFSAPRDHFEKQLPAFRAALASWRWS